MKKLPRDGVEDLVPYPPGKPIEELERELGIRGSIKLASNENPLGPSPLAIQAIRENAHKVHRYPDGSGYYLKQKISEKTAIAPERIILGNGSNELIELLIRTFLSPGENVVQAFPTFLVYEKVVKGAGGHVTSVPLKNLRVDLVAMSRAIKDHTKLVFIDNPNNPSGSVVSKADMRAFLEDLPEDVIVALDEAYGDFVTDASAARGLDLLDRHPLLFVMRTFSKLYGLAGLRIGYGLSSRKIVDFMNRVRQPFNVNLLAQIAACAALDDHEFVEKTRRTVKDGLQYLHRALQEMGLSYRPTHTNFFLIKVPQGGKRIYEAMLKKGVITRAMDSYGLTDHIRINIGLKEENERFIRTLKTVLG